jgi:hypothetical protein
MKMVQVFFAFVALMFAITPIHANAYIGPGMGLGMAATVLGIFVVFILLLAGLIWLPIRRFLREGKQNKKTQTSAADPNP